MYLYEGHQGGLFFSAEQLTYDETYCETCGDSDHLMGRIDSKEDLIQILSNADYEPSFIESFILTYQEIAGEL